MWPRPGPPPDTPARLALPADTVHLWWCHSRRPADDALAQLAADEHAAAARFHFDRDRQRHLATRWLLRRTLSRYAAVAPADWRFGRNAWGKPFVAAPDLAAPLHFNLSHSADVVLLAVARQPQLGVDVEAHPPDDWLPIARQVFAPAEIDWLRAAPAAVQGARFLRLWTLKEALVKALGQGLSAPLQQLVLQPLASSADDLQAGDAPTAQGDGHDDENGATGVAAAAGGKPWPLAARLQAAPTEVEADVAAWRFVAGRLPHGQFPWALALRAAHAQLRGPWRAP